MQVVTAGAGDGVSSDDNTWVAGVDGCHAGWLVVLRQTGTLRFSHLLVEHFAEVLALPEKPAVVAVDMPIGLLDAAVAGGRECDRKARELLGERGCCVFSPPVRAALRCATYDLACRANMSSSSSCIGVSRQAFGILPKLREVDECMTPALQRRVFEVHPELSFYELNERCAMTDRKKSAAGFGARRDLLLDVGFGEVISEIEASYRRKDVARDDILDACVCCWTAERILNGTGVRVPEEAPVDSHELRMEIWR